MNVLVTGAAGCIGSWVLRELLAADECPVAFDLSTDYFRLAAITSPEAVKEVRLIEGDVTDGHQLLRVMRDHRVERIIHLAACQIPLCRQDPVRGAMVNLVGTVNVFEAARATGLSVVYTSSAAVFGSQTFYPEGAVRDGAFRRPATHYGVYKAATEDLARVYWEDYGVPSVGFRPLSVYGPGRDSGLTANPTIAMKAAVLGRAFTIRWGGRTDLIYVEDAVRALSAATRRPGDGARVYNLHGVSASMAELVATIEREWPACKGKLSYVDASIPLPEALDDTAYQRDFGPTKATGLREGVRRTLETFTRLLDEGRLDIRELESGTADGNPGRGC